MSVPIPMGEPLAAMMLACREKKSFMLITLHSFNNKNKPVYWKRSHKRGI
jgi:hypothetical protein